MDLSIINERSTEDIITKWTADLNRVGATVSSTLSNDWVYGINPDEVYATHLVELQGGNLFNLYKLNGSVDRFSYWFNGDKGRGFKEDMDIIQVIKDFNDIYFS